MSTQNPGSGADDGPAPSDIPQRAETPPVAEPPTPTPESPPPVQGSIEVQEPGVTQPRPPTVAEARARDKARKQAQEAQRAAAAAEDDKRRTRKRIMMGGVAIVGVAGLVGGGYLAYRAFTAPDQVTASCVQVDEDGDEVVVEDQYCGPGRQNFHDDSSAGSLILLAGWPQYRYYYGGTNTIGQAPKGGTTVRPTKAEIKTKTGTVVQRGGLGSRSGSSS